jgi:multiple sugar transport system ATP-binding protein
MAAIALRNISKSYSGTEIIKGINLDVEAGEFVVFVGPSGCGKSTLLRIIAGLDEASSGQILIDGKVVNDTAPSKRGIAMVFQSYALYPHKSVYDNMAFGLQIERLPKKTITEKVMAAAKILHIENLLERKPGQLSGGQRQRVAIGRAIVRQPKVFLFDEPLSNLDAALRTDMRIELGKLHRQLGATMIYVTHDQTEAMTLADKIVVLDHGQIQQVGTPLDLYEHPANRFVAGFIGSPRMNFLPAQVIAAHADRVAISYGEARQASIPNTGNWQPGQALLIGIRPHDLSLDASAGGQIGGLVSLVERLGSETLVNVELRDGGQLIAALAGNAPATVGQLLDFRFDWARAAIFAADEHRL